MYDDLEIGDVIGQGSSSVVIRAKHSRFRSGRDCVYVALKVISAFEKSKRDQLIREISALYDCNCSAVVGFYGAFYREVRHARAHSHDKTRSPTSSARVFARAHTGRDHDRAGVHGRRLARERDRAGGAG